MELLAYRSEAIAEQLRGSELLLLAGTGVPVPAFAYPGVESRPAPRTAEQVVLGGRADIDVEDALLRLADLVAADVEPELAAPSGMGVPASRATTVEELYEQFRGAVATPGPHLIEAVLTPT